MLDLHGLIAESISELAFLAVKVNNLYAEALPQDALLYIGRERLIERYPTETDFSYRRRLQIAWPSYQWVGTSQSIENQLFYAGFEAYARDTTQWDWDGASADWSRFWVVITGHPFDAWHYDEDGYSWDGPQVWDSTATSADVALLRGIVRKWKPAHMRCSHLILVLDEASWISAQPDGSWGDPTNRSDGAIYFPG